MDCSPVDDIIIEHVSGLALQNRARVYLLHVVHSHTLGQQIALRNNADTCLKRHSEKLKSGGIEVEIIMKSGEPDREILKALNENSYDLVAMATHGHSFIGDILFGSVSRTLKHKINIPLLLIKSPH